jgi:hypothetical protein
MDLSAGRRRVAFRGRRGGAGRLGVAVTLALAGAGLAAAGAPAPVFAVGPTWSVVPTPNRLGPSNGSLKAISCASATACFAVGSSTGATLSQLSLATLIESWNGANWSIMKSPNKGSYPSLDGISCTSARACMAVGGYHISPASAETRSLIESWNGTKWSILPNPNPSNTYFAVLDAVSCMSATACTAVGDYFDNGVGPFTLIESWNGSTWSIVPSPTPAGLATGYVNLYGVSCTSATACMAVGNYFPTTGVVHTLAESWNGSKWSIVPSPIHNLDSSTLAGVSCVSATSCTAVGSYEPSTGESQTLIESWNGSTWSIVPSPSPDPKLPNGILAGVSCVSAMSCTAVGSYFSLSSGLTLTLAESWNGSKWSIVPSPDQGTDNNNALAGVSCRSASTCMTIGTEYPHTMLYSTDILQTLAESWHAGKWSIVRTINHLTYHDALNGVSCSSASFCVAVGFFLDSKRTDQTMVDSWNGATWSIVPSPKQGINHNQLSGVSCPSSKFCVAVGFYNGRSTLVESWNGSRWSVVPSPNVGNAHNYLSGVSCVSSTSCVTVGNAVVSGHGVEALIESWNGSKWSIVPSPNLNLNSGNLAGVSCVSARSCTAAGWYNTGVGPDQTLIESWNGSAWSIPSSPDQGTGDNRLAGISCRSASLCTAVGDYVNTGGVSQTLAESWNGSTWSIPSSPDQGTGNNTLAGISCPSASFCTAVGDYVNARGVLQTLIESWNGSTWSIVPSPNQGGGQNQLLAVSCVTTTSCAAAGDEATITGNQLNLAERFG